MLNLQNLNRMERNWKQSTIGHGAVINQKLSAGARYVNPYSDTAYYGGELVCESVGNKSDLQLIIAAPLLLDACKQFVYGVDNHDDVELKNAYLAAKKAMSIAEPVQLLLTGYGSKQVEAQKDFEKILKTMLDALEMIDEMHINMWSDKRHKLDSALSVGREFHRRVLGD